MELNIYSKDGSLKLTVSPSESSTVTEEVGGECSVSLSFETFELCAIEVNDYIEVAGVRYKARMAYRPKMRNRQSYSYSLRFYAPIHDAQQALMKTETDGGLISEFSLWGGPREHLQKWVDNMNRLAGSELWTIGSVITGENKNIDYRNVNCWDAAFGSNGIASTYETEMWADGYVINLCKCERGERITLGYGAGLTSLTPEDNSDKVRFFTRLFPLGSTRNINVSTYGSSRLQLPSRATFVDHNTDRYGVFEDSEEDAFAGIFPQYIGTVTAVRSEPKTDENGKKFTVYYIKDSGMTWEPQALPEQTFMLSFQTGDLQGYGDDTNKSFQAEWHKDTKEWEIINIWLDENTQVPGGNIVPVVGNQYFPWNMIMPQEYITEAEKRYEAAVNDFVANYSGEPVAYSGSTDYIHCAKQAVSLRIGQNVRLESDLYFEEGYQNTRITKVVRKLCRLTDATVTFAEQIGTGWKKSVDNQLSSLHYELQRQAEQAGIDMIKTTDSKTPSDNNVFSALRSLATFLRKDKADSTSHLLTLLAGAVFGDNKAEITAEGVAKFLSMVINGGKASIDTEGLLTAVNAIIKGDVKSDNFLAGALGTGYAILKKDTDGKSYLEVDKLFARVKAIFAVLEIMKVTYTGGNFVFSPAGMQCTKVEEYDTYYRCYFTADDGEKAVENTFEVDDMVQLREFNVKAGVYDNVSNRYFWRKCITKGSNYIDLSKSDRDMTSNDAPMVGDSLVTIGNKTIKSRQNVIIISVYGEGSPSIIQYAGVNDYSFDGKAVTVISPSGNKFTGSFIVQATGKSVEDELSTAVEVADAAKKAAEKAQEDADAANTELKTIASDSYITPSEKTALKQQQADIQAERNEIIANATRYGVSYSAYDTAYTAANNALTYYSGATPTNIPVNSDYANISAYYAARKTILDAIATAAKKLVTDLDDDLQGYKSEVTQKFEAVDGRFTSVITETKTYTDNAVGNIQVGTRNLLLNSGEKIIPNSTSYFVHKYDSSVQFKVGEKYTIVVKGSTSVGQRFGIWINGSIAWVGQFSNNMQGEASYIHVTMPSNIGSPLVSFVNVYNAPNPNGASKPCEIEWIAMYEGHIKPPMDWTPAPEDLTTKIEVNSSKIEQLPDQITLQVKKDITGGHYNYISGTSTPSVLKISPTSLGFVHNYYIQPECKGKKILTAYKLKLEGCSFSSDATMITQVGPQGGWPSWYESIIPGKALTTNGEFLLYGIHTAPSNITGQAKLNLRMTGVSGGTATISEMRCYEVKVDSVAESDILPWYPSKWDGTSLSSEIKQTADNISLKVNQVVGGTNLLSNTSFSADLSGWALLNSSTGMTAKIVSKGGYQCLELWTDGARRGLYAYLDNRSLVKAGDKFTISFDLYRTSSAVSTLAIGLEDGGADFIKKTLSGNLNTWVRLTYTQTMDTNNAAFIIYGAGNAGTVYIKNIKVEMGTIATAWTPSPLEQNNKLLATGIDIYNKRIDITADKLRIKNNSGTPIAVFDGSGSTPKLKAANIDVDNLKVKHLDGADGTFKGSLSAATGTFSGTITAGSVFSGRLQSPTGNIGDLEISGGYLSSNGGGKKGIAFTSNYMSNYFENISSQKTITMDPGDGYGAKPYTFTLLGNRKAEVRKSNTSVNHIYVADMMNIQYTGFLKDSRYGFQYAMLGSGHCILDGVVDGGCWGHIAFEENNTFEQINPHLIGNRIIITPSYSNNYVIFPTLVKMHMFLGQDIAQRVSGQFTYVITIINQSTNAVAIMGRANTTIGSLNLNNSQFPKFYNQSGTLMDQPREYTIKPFCARQFMLAYDGGEFYAFEL